MSSLSMPIPKFILPLDNGMSNFSVQPLQLERMFGSFKSASDRFGFPIVDGYFDGSADAVISVITQIQEVFDFTLSLQVRPEMTEKSVKRAEQVLFWIGDITLASWLVVGMSNENLEFT